MVLFFLSLQLMFVTLTLVGLPRSLSTPGALSRVVALRLSGGLHLVRF